MQKIYSLTPYFNTIKYMVYYYDVRIKQLNITKEALFNELSISHMTYKRAKEFDSNSGREMTLKLNKYFGINDIDYKKQDEYERIVNQVIHRFYYRGENLGEFLPLLDSCIEDNNYLKPLFLLLKVLINFTTIKNPPILLYENKDIYEEVKKYNTQYLISPFKEIFILIDILYSRNKVYEFDTEVEIADTMKGLIYNSYCTNAFMAGKYDLCLYYASESKKYLEDDFNYNRLILINLTYFACLNKLGEYKKCMKESRKQLLYLEETKQQYDLIYATTIHFYTACIGTKNYQEIIDILKNKEGKNKMEYMFLLVAANCNDKLYNQCIDEYRKNAYIFSDKKNAEIKLLIEFLSGEDRKNKKDELIKSSISIGLKDILVKKF